jgi:hypothetical protein
MFYLETFSKSKKGKKYKIKANNLIEVDRDKARAQHIRRSIEKFSKEKYDSK